MTSKKEWIKALINDLISDRGQNPDTRFQDLYNLNYNFQLRKEYEIIGIVLDIFYDNVGPKPCTHFINLTVEKVNKIILNLIKCRYILEDAWGLTTTFEIITKNYYEKLSEDEKQDMMYVALTIDYLVDLFDMMGVCDVIGYNIYPDTLDGKHMGVPSILKSNWENYINKPYDLLGNYYKDYFPDLVYNKLPSIIPGIMKDIDEMDEIKEQQRINEEEFKRTRKTRMKKVIPCDENPIIGNRIVNDKTFAIRLRSFLKDVNVCDEMGQEEKNYLMMVANKLINYQAASVTEPDEKDYLTRCNIEI